jgi:hypothetical protein
LRLSFVRRLRTVDDPDVVIVTGEDDEKGDFV